MGNVTPYVADSTIGMTAEASIPTSGQMEVKPASYYLGLWAKVLKRRRSQYEVVVDNKMKKVCFRKKLHPAILWFSIDNAVAVRNWYINFRLCDNNFALFFKHYTDGTLENEDIVTPPHEFNVVPPKYV